MSGDSSAANSAVQNHRAGVVATAAQQPRRGNSRSKRPAEKPSSPRAPSHTRFTSGRQPSIWARWFPGNGRLSVGVTQCPNVRRASPAAQSDGLRRSCSDGVEGGVSIEGSATLDRARADARLMFWERCQRGLLRMHDRRWCPLTAQKSALHDELCCMQQCRLCNASAEHNRAQPHSARTRKARVKLL